jgi:hypothetical protein
MKKIFTNRWFIWAIVFIAVAGVVFWKLWFFNSRHDLQNEAIDKQIENLSSNNLTENEIDSTLSPAFVPEGWKTYVSDKWRGQREPNQIAFSYPSNWTLQEKREEESGEITEVVLQGDGYRIKIDRRGRGMGSPYNYITDINGYGARTWQAGYNEGYILNLGVVEADFIFSIIIPDKTKELSDKILSTIKFSK